MAGTGIGRWTAAAGPAALCAALTASSPVFADGRPGRLPPGDETRAAAAEDSAYTYIVRHDRWTGADERLYGAFIAAIGRADCHTVNTCLRSAANPYRASDPPSFVFQSDCGDLPYYLRAYFAWKRGLPFAYERAIAPVGEKTDARYSPDGNRIVEQTVVTTGSTTGPELLETLRAHVSSAMYRIDPDREHPFESDFYSPAIRPGAIRLGTVIYDPNGHLAIVYRIDPDGRVFYIDAHPDNSLTRGTYDRRFVRSRPGMGAGFKNWRPIVLERARREAGGALDGGTIHAAANADIADFSDEQYYGNARQRVRAADWKAAQFTLGGERLDYYDYVRAKLAGGRLRFDPVKEVREMVQSNCADLKYRAEAVDAAIAARIETRDHPARLPYNIYGTRGDWEIYSTPSRDARLKTAFKALRDAVLRFLAMQRAGDKRLDYAGHNLAGDMLAAYDGAAAACRVSYRKSDGEFVTFGYEQARRRLFRMSFDPYHCPELRWGAKGAELASCRDGDDKRAWYAAENRLRNQIDRTYEARMDHDLAELRAPGGTGKGVAVAPETEVRGLLLAAADPRLRALGD
jgi:hypothetical protein